jgi:hypothetical protein
MGKRARGQGVRRWAAWSGMAVAMAGCGPSTIGKAVDAELRDRGFEPQSLPLEIDEAASQIEGEFGDARLMTSPDCSPSLSTAQACAQAGARELRRELAEVLRARWGARGPNAAAARFRLKGKEDFEVWYYAFLPPLLFLGLPYGRDKAEVTIELDVGGEVFTASGQQDMSGGIYSAQFLRGALANAIADAIEQLESKLRARRSKSSHSANAAGGTP